MDRINLTKYGFIRRPALDFSDDGSRFRCYELDGIEVSYLKSNYGIYISGHSTPISGGMLKYDEYSKLPHYKALDNLNGVDDVEESELYQLANDIRAYAKEYREAEAKLEYPSEEEARSYIEEHLESYRSQLYELDAKLRLKALWNLSEYKIKDLVHYSKSINSKINYLEDALKNLENYIRTNRVEIKQRKKPDTWYYEECLEILAGEK